MHHFFIIPQKRQSIIATVEQEKIIPIRSIDIPYESKSVITDNGYIVSLYHTNKKLRIHDLDGNLIYKEEKLQFEAISLRNNIVYLGGESKSFFQNKDRGEIFSLLDLNNPPYIIKKIVLPIELISGKAIDDILVQDTTLILVDNVVFPKYILEYNIENAERPSFIKMTCLPNDGTYGSIKKGDINADYMVLFSMTVGSRGVSQHITISGKLEQKIKRSIRAGDLLVDEFDVKKYWSYQDICLVDNSLLLVRTDDIGYINLQSKELNEGYFHRIDTQLPSVHRIIKDSDNHPIAINDNGYQLLVKFNDKWIAKP